MEADRTCDQDQGDDGGLKRRCWRFVELRPKLGARRPGPAAGSRSPEPEKRQLDGCNETGSVKRCFWSKRQESRLKREARETPRTFHRLVGMRGRMPLWREDTRRRQMMIDGGRPIGIGGDGGGFVRKGLTAATLLKRRPESVVRCCG